jgi:hypothetical protein
LTVLFFLFAGPALRAKGMEEAYTICKTDRICTYNFKEWLLLEYRVQMQSKLFSRSQMYTVALLCQKFPLLTKTYIEHSIGLSRFLCKIQQNFHLTIQIAEIFLRKVYLVRCYRAMQFKKKVWWHAATLLFIFTSTELTYTSCTMPLLQCNFHDISQKLSKKCCFL